MGQRLFFCIGDKWQSTACIHTFLFPYSPNCEGCTLTRPMPSAGHAWVLSEPLRLCQGNHSENSMVRHTQATCSVWQYSPALTDSLCEGGWPQLPSSSPEEVHGAESCWGCVLSTLLALASPGGSLNLQDCDMAGWCPPVQCRAACIPPSIFSSLHSWPLIPEENSR